jgi:N-acetylmuramoyl-L-alanine amidase CwlA
MSKKRKKRRLTKKQYYRRKRLKSAIRISFALLLIITIVSIALTGTVNILSWIGFHNIKQVKEVEINAMYLTPNEYSRPTTKLKRVKGIVIHYTANPGTSAEDNRNYFEGLATSYATSASSHFIIGIKGEIIQCIPLDEIAYASNKRNFDTISIECCHPDSTGKFTKETYDSLVKLTAWLSGKYDISKKDVIRHYDVTGKNCPKYYVENKDAWITLRNDIYQYIDEYGE